MRIAVTGRTGQLVTALAECGRDAGFEIIPVGRPELDLAWPANAASALAAVRPDIIVSAAAYTAVDKAESDRIAAFAVNADGAGAIAEAAARLRVPLLHLSTDYVFDGAKPEPYVETDPPAPINVYGASKLAGEERVAEATADHLILRTSWVYSPFGANFVKTMLALAQSRDSVAVIADQHGRPTSALDIARAVIAIATRAASDSDPALRGIFNLAGSGDETTWAGFADAIFDGLRARGGKKVSVTPITTAEYPVAARRPVNSRLSGEKLARLYGIVLPDWRESLSVCLDRLVPAALVH
jgi:dTDP-4-dehydrorhamnose reductase